MARRRLRHKLMLGLVLVAGSVGLLVFGTCYGIYGYYTSVKTTERKLEELQIVTLMIKALNAFEQPGTNGHEHYLVQIESTKAQLAWFNLKSAGNVNAGLDPDGGEMENGLVPQLTEQLKVLEAAVAKAHGPGTHNEVSPGPLHQHQEVRPAHEKARLTAENLRQALVDDIQTSCRESKAAITRTIFIVGFAVLWASRSSAPCCTTSASGCSRRSANSRPACSGCTAERSTSRSSSPPATSCKNWPTSSTRWSPGCTPCTRTSPGR